MALAREEPPLLIAVMGVTASGKSQLAEQLADKLGAELINADAFQIYRGMDIGTAKSRAKDRYHLIDIKNPNEDFGLGEFCVRSQELLEGFWTAGKHVIVVGGTGLYIRGLFEDYSTLKPSPPAELREAIKNRLEARGLPALVEELRQADPARASKVDLRNPIRVTRALESALDKRPSLSINLPAYRKLKLAPSVDKQELESRLANRAHSMVQNGWVDEVETLLARNYGPGDPGFRALGYQELADYLLGKTGLEEAVATTIAQTRRYAKRQRTWLRSEPGLTQISAVEGRHYDGAMLAIQSFCNGGK